LSPSRSGARALAAAAVALAFSAAHAAAADEALLDVLLEDVDIAEGLSFLEELLGTESDDGADRLDAVLRDAAALREHPLDVNTAGFSELLRVPLIDPAGAAAIVARREVEGPILSLDELVGLPGMRREVVQALRPYLVVSPLGGPPSDAAPGDVLTAGGAAASGPSAGGAAPRHEGTGAGVIGWSLRARASCREADIGDASARGAAEVVDAATTYARLRVFGPGGLEAGLACERDAAEGTLLDHTAFHLTWGPGRGGEGVRSGEPFRLVAVAGDLVGEWAQGIVVSGARFPTARRLPRPRDRFRGYDGASESTARRGILVDVSRGFGRVQILAARTRLDAALDDLGRVTTIRSSGYHRTEGERRGADALAEALVGARATADVLGTIELGASFLRFGFDPPLGPGHPERQRFRFEGSALEIASADVRVATGAWRLGAEVARTSGGGRGALASARVRRGDATIHLGFGSLSRRYWSPLGGGVPGFSGGSNGLAGWIGADYRIARRVMSRINLLVGGRPWRPYSDELPGRFRKWVLGIEFPLGRLGDVTLEARSRSSRAGGGDPPESIDGATRSTRVIFRAFGAPPVTLFVQRAAASVGEAESGSATAVGARGEFEISPALSLNVGVTSVARNGEGRPLFQHEPALPGEFGLRSLSESGTRWYARLAAGLSPSVGLSVRLGGGPGRGRSEVGVGIDAKG